MAWLFWPASRAVTGRIARYLLHGVAVLARIGGRYEPCRMEWLFWPVSLAAMSRIGRHLLDEVAALARVADRFRPYPGGHACLSAVMPASAACQDPWRRANTLHTVAGRLSVAGRSRCGAGASPSVLLPEAPGLRGGCWCFHGLCISA